jgi:hypothetical protein
MSTVKTYYAQVPLGIAIKNIEQHQLNEMLEESSQDAQRNPDAIRPVRTSVRKGAERGQPMSN